MRSKKQLAVRLSQLASFQKPSLHLEQYSTDSEIAAEIIWEAFLQGDVDGKGIADLGCGTGILGIGCLLMGAKHVYFVDKDERVLRQLKDNLTLFDLGNHEIICSDVSEITLKVDTVIQNPPFGTKEKHADKKFLKTAFTISDTIYTFHKSNTDGFVQAIIKDNGFIISRRYDVAFPIKRMHDFHKKKLERIDVSVYRLIKKQISS